MSSLAGRVALVTGASKGIGRACALRLAAMGATVAVCARKLNKLAQVVVWAKRVRGASAGRASGGGYAIAECSVRCRAAGHAGATKSRR